jgi:HAE1 family hydrophobic/amphiphilic exporter-1
VLCVIPALASEAGEGPVELTAAAGPAGGETVVLSLSEAVKLALENNLDLQIERINPLLADATIMTAESAFEPLFFLNSQAGRSQRPGAVVFSDGLAYTPVNVSDSFTVGAGVRKLFATGANVRLSYDHVRSASPPGPGSQSGVAGLTVTQPLLRDAWFEPTLRDLRLAENDKLAVDAQLESAVLETVATVEVAYWDLVFVRQELDIKKRLLALTEEFFENNKQRAEAGIVADIEVLRSEANVASRRAALLEAENSVKRAEDNLRRLLRGPRLDVATTGELVPADAPTEEGWEVDLKHALYLALSQRPELRAAKIALESRGIDVRVAKNELLPRLDLTGFYRARGAGTSLASVYEDIDSLFYEDYGAAVSVEVPLGNKRARSELTKAHLRELRDLLAWKRLEENIIIEVKDMVRSVLTAHQEIAGFEAARALAGKQLEAEMTNFEVGRSTGLDVLRVQQDFAQAETDKLQAVVSYNRLLAELRRATASYPFAR